MCGCSQGGGCLIQWIPEAGSTVCSVLLVCVHCTVSCIRVMSNNTCLLVCVCSTVLCCQRDSGVHYCH